MKSTITWVLCASLLVGAAFAATQKSDSKSADKKTEKTTEKKKPDKKATEAPKPLPFKDLKENISYAIGLNFGMRTKQNINRQFGGVIEVDYKQLAKALKIGNAAIKRIQGDGVQIIDKRLHEGFQDGVTGENQKMTEKQIAEVFKKLQEQLLAERKKAEEKRKKDNKDFLAKNKKKKGVVETKSGLQYQIIKEGKGKKPKASDVIVAHYVGTLLDGKVFDSSRKRGIPATFQVGRVIPGWQEALQLMRVGSKWKLFIPPELGYGERGAGSDIPGHSVLVFEVELLEIKDLSKPKSKEKSKSKKSEKTKSKPEEKKKKE